MNDPANTRERIILATLVCIERDGFDALTIRAIAAEAAVNVAAVNYHFGSKAKLVEEVLRHTLHTAFTLEELDAFLAGGMDRRSALEAFVVKYLHDAVRYPRLAQAHLHDPFVRGEYPEAIVRGFGAFLEGFLERAEPVLVGRTRRERRHGVVQLWCAVLLPVFLPGLFPGFGVTFDEAEVREAYVRDLLKRFLV